MFIEILYMNMYMYNSVLKRHLVLAPVFQNYPINCGSKLRLTQRSHQQITRVILCRLITLLCRLNSSTT